MEVGRRPSSIVRSSPLIKGSNLNKVRGYPFGTVYGRGGIDEKQINRIVEEEQEQIYQVPEANNHITTIPLRTPPPPPTEDKNGSLKEITIDKNNHLNVTTSCPPFAHRNNSMRSPRQASKLDKSQTTSSINTLRRESEMVRKASRTPSGGNISQQKGSN